MPDDDQPLSSTVTETVTTDTGADKEVVESLNAQFEDFWKEEDKKTDGAPSAPGDEGAAQETKEAKRETKREIRETPEPKRETATTETPKEYTDEEIDRLALTRSDRPEAIEDFKQLKAGWKAARAQAKAMREEVDKLSAQLSDAKVNAWTPEAKADYEHAAAIRRKFDFASDPDFQAKFHQPITNTFHGVLNEAVDALPDRAQAQAWAKYIADNYSPESLDRNWWLNSVIAKIPNEMDRASVLQSVTNLIRMQKERDQEVNRRTNDKSSFDNWVKERDTSKAQNMQKEVMDEIGIQEQKIKEILKKDPTEAKTKEEREAIDKHNERFEKLNGHFQETMKDLSFNGPRAMVRAAVQATRAEYIEGEYKTLEKELKSVRAERDQFKTELDKIQGARRRISHTTGTPPASSKDKSNGEGLSIKNLDVRKSFDAFDWGDGTK